MNKNYVSTKAAAGGLPEIKPAYPHIVHYSKPDVPLCTAGFPEHPPEIIGPVASDHLIRPVDLDAASKFGRELRLAGERYADVMGEEPY